MQKKHALVLSGGGFKGAYQLGALRYIRDNWNRLTGLSEMRFDLIAGVSAGALNGALVAANRFDDLEKLWRQVYEHGGKEIYTSSYLTETGRIQLSFDQLSKDLLPNFKVNAGLIVKGVWNSLRNAFNKKVPGLVATLLKAAEKDFDANLSHFKSLADNKPLADKLDAYVSRSDIPASTTFLCGLVSLNDGLYYALSDKSFDNDDDFAAAILASSAMPVIWPPVPKVAVQETEQVIQNAIDGGLRNTSPLRDVVDFIDQDPSGAPYEVWIINCNSGYIVPADRQWNIADIALRALTEITLAEIFNDDVRAFLKMNDLVRQADQAGLQLHWKGQPIRHFDYALIQPTRDELGDTLDSSASRIAERELLGYAHAEAALGYRDAARNV